MSHDNTSELLSARIMKGRTHPKYQGCVRPYFLLIAWAEQRNTQAAQTRFVKRGQPGCQTDICAGIPDRSLRAVSPLQAAGVCLQVQVSPGVSTYLLLLRLGACRGYAAFFKGSHHLGAKFWQQFFGFRGKPNLHGVVVKGL